MENQLSNKLYWWLNPYKLMVFFLIPFFIMLFFVDEGSIQLEYSKYLNGDYFLMGIAFLICFASAAFVATKIKINDQVSREQYLTVNPTILDIIAILTIMAYLIWFGDEIIHPKLFLSILETQKGAVYDFRRANSTIPGLTSLTQLGVVYIVLYFNSILGLKAKFNSKRYRNYFLLILLLTIFRVIAWSERLALIELCIPIVMLYLLYTPVKRKFWKYAISSAPFLGILLLILFFGVTEYFRSWSNHYIVTEQGFIQFVVSRIMTYYYTALNNGAGLLATNNWPTWDFQFIGNWLFQLPFIGDFFKGLVGKDLIASRDFLVTYADPEFSNKSGIYTVFSDVGISGALIYATIWGALAGFLYKTWVNISGIGVVMYPVFFISMLEVFRILYLSGPRAIPILASILIIYVFFKNSKSGYSLGKKLKRRAII